MNKISSRHSVCVLLVTVLSMLGVSPVVRADNSVPSLIDLLKGNNVTLEQVQVAIRAGANVNARDNTGTVLIWAVKNGDIGILKALIGAGADINARDNEGDTALRTAALIAEGADINARENDRNKPSIAEQKNYAAILRFLLTNGADINEKTVDGTALSSVVSLSNVDNDTGIIVSANANLLAQWTDQSTLAQLAVKFGDPWDPALRLVAASHLNDQGLLAKVATTDTNVNVRYAAAGRIHDFKVLDQVARAPLNKEDANYMETILALRKLLARYHLNQGFLTISLFSSRDQVATYSPGPGSGFSVYGDTVKIAIIRNDETVLAHGTWTTHFPFAVSVGGYVPYYTPAKVNLADLVSQLRKHLLATAQSSSSSGINP